MLYQFVLIDGTLYTGAASFKKKNRDRGVQMRAGFVRRQ
jgi:hypothetical protein